MTRRQSDNQWSGGIAAHPAPKNFECKNPLETFWPRFFGIEKASSPLIIFQRAKLTTRSIIYLRWCNWRKNAAGSSQRESCSCMTMPRLTRHLQPRRNWSTWAASILISNPILRIGLCRTTTCSLDWKNNWKVANFVRHRSHYCRGDLVKRTIFWIFLSGLQKLEQQAKKGIELRWEYVE